MVDDELKHEMRNVVIIGSGHGGVQAAASLREYGFSGDITMIAAEAGLPYHRPPLSKSYLSEGNDDKLVMRPWSFYESSNIRLLSADPAVVIDRYNQRVQTASGKRLAYDHLILALGADNLTPSIGNSRHPSVLRLRTRDEAQCLRARLASSRHTIIIGGGFIGLEVAATARNMGLPVTLIEAQERLMARVVSPSISQVFEKKHRDMGTQILTEAVVSEILIGADGSTHGVELFTGGRIEGDLVLLAVGVAPRIDIAAAAGLEITNGIKADATLQTSDTAISVLGDGAEFPEARTRQRVRLESVQAATDHARTIAHRLTGFAAQYDALPWFWSDQADC